MCPAASTNNCKNPQQNLPPGFRFHPTDEELILHYLRRKLASSPLPVAIIAEVNINKFDPPEFPEKAVFGEKEWYYFSPRDRKYPNGARPNRAATSGYWKATGTDKVIVNSTTGENIGIKKVLVFYKGKPPKGIKTHWIMHEYRLTDAPGLDPNDRAIGLKDSSVKLDKWVLCRIYQKPNGTTAIPTASPCDFKEDEASVGETSRPKTLRKAINSYSFSNLLDAVDLSFVRSILADNDNVDSAPESSQVAVINHDQKMCRPVPTVETGLKRKRLTGDTEIITSPSP